MTAPVPPPEQAPGDGLREALACCLARQDGWDLPHARWTDNQTRIQQGDPGDPVWWDYREDADALLAGPFAPVLADLARVTAERDEARDLAEQWEATAAAEAEIGNERGKERDEALTRAADLAAVLSRLVTYWRDLSAPAGPPESLNLIVASARASLTEPRHVR